MKITFLGTSHGVPDEHRHCCCFLLELGGADGPAYLIDGGAPVADLLTRRGVAFDRVKAFFNTHVHSDHLLGALPFFSLVSWYYRRASVQVFLPEKAACEAVRHMLTLTDGAFDQDRVLLTPYDATWHYDDGRLRVTPIATRHMAPIGRPSYALLVEAEGRRVLFAGDLAADLSDFPALLYDTPVDLLVTECAHFPVQALTEKLAGTAETGPVRAGTVGVLHIHPLEEKKTQLEHAAASLPMPLVILHDDEEILL